MKRLIWAMRRVGLTCLETKAKLWKHIRPVCEFSGLRVKPLGDGILDQLLVDQKKQL